MDPVLNPFVPGAGTQPPKMAGREDLLERTRITLERMKAGRGSKSFIVVGLRGVGKTVLLNQVYTKATELEFCAVQIEAHENKSLSALLTPQLRQILFRLDKLARASEKAKQGLRVLAAFANSLKASVGDIEFGLSIDPEIGIADSGDLEADLADLFEVVAAAAKDAGTVIVLIIDELQYLSEAEMSALIMALHRIAQRNLPLMLVGGGLPQLVGLAGNSKSYAERLFDYPEIGPLLYADTELALVDPIEHEGSTITDQAVRDIYMATKGYPYFLQTWGHFAWNISEGPEITSNDVHSASDNALSNLDESFFRVRFDRLTPTERAYLFAMAAVGPGPHRSGEIATELEKKVESVSPTRSSLIKKGMVYSPSHGDTAFTVPMFDEYLNRTKRDD